MSRISWSSQRVLGSVALACALVVTSAVPALGAVSLPPTASTSAAPSSPVSGGYTTTSVASAKTQAAAAKTLKSAVPKISGTAKVGQKLTVSRGGWTSGTKLTQRWLRNGAAISGAAGTSYTPTAADRGKTITVTVTGSKPGYTTKTVASAKTKVVAAGTLKSAVPKISGTVKAGQKVTVSRGSWTSGTKLTQRWYRNGAAIAAATGTSYTPKSGDAGSTLTVKVTGSKTGYATVTKASAGVKVQAAAKPKPSTSGRVKPNGKSCPASHPIKGNASSKIYHKPGGQYYARTVPEDCFKTESAARAAGYRASKK